MLTRYVFITLMALACLVQQPLRQETISSPQNADRLAAFSKDLEQIRQVLRIPGMSAVVVANQAVIWADGFGYADLENEIAATADTPYGLASVTKPIAATLIMQLVEDGLIDLDALVSDYGVAVEGNSPITARHLLTHTSEGVPGTNFRYNGNRYALLGGVMDPPRSRSE